MRVRRLVMKKAKHPSDTRMYINYLLAANYIRV